MRVKGLKDRRKIRVPDLGNCLTGQPLCVRLCVHLCTCRLTFGKERRKGQVEKTWAVCLSNIK